MIFKNYLVSEDDRNRANHKLYERLIRLATGPDTGVLVVHHITFTLADDSEPNEIPSADCLLFDHDFMSLAFGIRMYMVMSQLAILPLTTRDKVLEEFVADEEKRRVEEARSNAQRTNAVAGD